jgi:hypothetical protein
MAFALERWVSWQYKLDLFIDPFFKLVSIEKSALDKTSIAQKVRAVTCFDSL